MKQLYYFKGSISPSDGNFRNCRYIDVTKKLYDPFVALLSNAQNTRSRTIQEYGLTIGYFAPLTTENRRTHNVWDEISFEILGTRDALLYIFPRGKNLLFDDEYSIRLNGIQPMNTSEDSEGHEASLRNLQKWMRDIHAENLRRINMGYCDYDE